MNLDALKTELLAMAADDLRMRDPLIAEGSLFAGYHPRIREVHERNAIPPRQANTAQSMTSASGEPPASSAHHIE